MVRVASSSMVVRQIGSLFEGGSVAGLSDRQLLDPFVCAGTLPVRRLLPRSSPGTGRWFYSSAGGSWVITSMPRIRFRPSFSVLVCVRSRCAIPIC